MTEETFEILIGKYLDGEITPSEQRLLEAKLDSDPKAAEVLEQFRNLHQRSSEVLASELLEKGKSPQEIFANAFKQSKHKRNNIIRLSSWMRFATGVAAGLIFGIFLHFYLLQSPPGKITAPVTPPFESPKYVKTITDDMLLGTPNVQKQKPGQTTRNVDGYIFTDQNGNQWMVEGLRQNSVRPAVYQQGL
jgi:hypothetical protein